MQFVVVEVCAKRICAPADPAKTQIESTAKVVDRRPMIVSAAVIVRQS